MTTPRGRNPFIPILQLSFDVSPKTCCWKAKNADPMLFRLVQSRQRQLTHLVPHKKWDGLYLVARLVQWVVTTPVMTGQTLLVNWSSIRLEPPGTIKKSIFYETTRDLRFRCGCLYPVLSSGAANRICFFRDPNFWEEHRLSSPTSTTSVVSVPQRGCPT